MLSHVTFTKLLKGYEIGFQTVKDNKLCKDFLIDI